MKRIWNAMRYGDAETRKCIGIVLFFSIAAFALVVVSCITQKFALFILGMIAAVVAIVYSQTFTLLEDDFVAEVDRIGTKNTVQSVSIQRRDDEEEQQLAPPQIQEAYEKDRFKQYDQQTMKKVKKQNHVKRDHRPIIIDYSSSLHIKECPAFVWKTYNKVYILLLEKKPRKLCIPRELIRQVSYKPGVRGDHTKEYIPFREENLVTEVFNRYLPDYNDSKDKDDPSKYKNLYTIYPDIRITNRSIYQLMDLLGVEFRPKNKITDSDKVNTFFKRIYVANILYRDQVYDVIKYKEAVEDVLGDMCHSQITAEEFVTTLENLVRGSLISQEYADYYTELKKRIPST